MHAVRQCTECHAWSMRAGVHFQRFAQLAVLTTPAVPPLFCRCAKAHWKCHENVCKQLPQRVERSQQAQQAQQTQPQAQQMQQRQQQAQQQPEAAAEGQAPCQAAAPTLWPGA